MFPPTQEDSGADEELEGSKKNKIKGEKNKLEAAAAAVACCGALGWTIFGEFGKVRGGFPFLEWRVSFVEESPCHVAVS